MKYGILDLEADALLDEVTKIHCICFSVYEDGNGLGVALQSFVSVIST